MRNVLPVPGGGGLRTFAPPLRFKPISGAVQSAKLVDDGPFANVSRLKGSAAQRNGKRYERRVLAELTAQLPNFLPSQWFEFRDNLMRRYCQVDGLFLAGEAVAIFEIKYSFTPDAWWQLRKLYEPVVRKALSPKRLGLFVICRNFDPHVPFPETVRMSTPSTKLGNLWEGDTSMIDVIPWRI